MWNRIGQKGISGRKSQARFALSEVDEANNLLEMFCCHEREKHLQVYARVKMSKPGQFGKQRR
jgi:hypothetical protein